jgi:hypothetical protein
MPPRSKVQQLPAAVKSWLDEQLVESNFSGYERLAAELGARGYTISKTALNNYGQEFEDRLAAVKLATEQARAVVAAAPDEDNSVNDALIRLVQERIFVLLKDTNSDKVDLPKITRAIADLGRVSISQRKFAAEVRAKIEAELAAMEEEGFDKDTLDAAKNRISIYLPDNKR